MAKRKPPAFPLYARDWNEATSELTLEEQGLYMRLLCHSWSASSIPSDPARIASVGGVSRTHLLRLWKVVGEFWEPVDGDASRLVNPRQEEVRADHAAYWKQKSDAGKASAEARRGQREGNGTPNETATEPSTKRQPSSSSASSTSSPSPPPTPSAAPPEGGGGGNNEPDRADPEAVDRLIADAARRHRP
jgi:uncharacterized protein YdaU (DUF1376 family)